MFVAQQVIDAAVDRDVTLLLRVYFATLFIEIGTLVKASNNLTRWMSDSR
eukprot:SAG31_NODE_31865_length_363_cov_0.628788_1_plen_49_part_10